MRLTSLDHPISRPPDNVVFLFPDGLPAPTARSPFFQELGQRFTTYCWDIRSLIQKGMPETRYGERVASGVTAIASIDAFRTALRDVDATDTVLVVHLPAVQYRRNTEAVLREISRRGIDYVILDVANSFGPRKDFNWFRSAANRLKRKSMLGFRNRRIWFWNDVRPPLFALVASQIVEDWLRIQGLHTRYVRAHSRDYESYLQLKREDPGGTETDNVGVFLDQGIGTITSDAILFGEHPRVSFESYCAQVGAFLRRVIEAQSLDGFRFILHPSNFTPPDAVKSALKLDPCEVMKGGTAAAIRRCSVVVSQSSSALALAVLYEKPIAFFYADTDDPQASARPNVTSRYARLLGRRVNYPDSPNLDVGVDVKRYRKFRLRYVKEPDTIDRSYYRILGDQLSRVGSD